MNKHEQILNELEWELIWQVDLALATITHLMETIACVDDNTRRQTYKIPYEYVNINNHLRVLSLELHELRQARRLTKLEKLND